MMNIDLNYISVDQAKKINKILSNQGVPSENKVLILSPTGETKSGSIIIPGTADNSKPKKGVVVQISHITDDENFMKKVLHIGSIVTYGLYAGKELELSPDIFPEDLRHILDDNNLTILSLNEIAYIENNK